MGQASHADALPCEARWLPDPQDQLERPGLPHCHHPLAGYDAVDKGGGGFTPEGIPRGPWSEAVTAEPFWLSCHSAAQVGDVLGEVVVRRDLASDFLEWVADMRLSGLLWLGKIVLYSVLLLLILRVRRETLLGLHSVVSRLARAYGGLTHWAEMGGCLGTPSPPSLHLNQTVYPPAESMKGVRTPCV